MSLYLSRTIWGLLLFWAKQAFGYQECLVIGGTTYYCNDGTHCCNGDTACCEDGSGDVGLVIGIVVGVIVGKVILITLCVFACKKYRKCRSPQTVIRQPVVATIGGSMPYAAAMNNQYSQAAGGFTNVASQPSKSAEMGEMAS